MMRRLFALLLVVLALAAVIAALNFRDEAPLPERSEPPSGPADPAQIARGAYLARAGNCATCHTARGGAPYAGGLGIATPFGTVYSSNLTPDDGTGLGRWSAAQFWRALHNGRSADGRLLYPAFPYPSFTRVTREDSDALFAYLRSLPAVAQPNRPHALRFPYSSQAALAVWRALFFQPGVYRPDAGRSQAWNRGAYLVRGLGHCSACHAGRNLFGATVDSLELSGGLIPMQDWYAPALNASHEAGVAGWELLQVVDLLKTGVTAGAATLGPMAEVVKGSTRHLSDDDLRAIATYLQALPQARPPPPRDEPPSVDPGRMASGRSLYADHCARCHGDGGQGVPGAYSPLAGNRAVMLDSPANLIRVVLAGGFPPATTGNPKPYGMPPFATTLDDADVAALLTYVRNAWGNVAEPVSPLEVQRLRGGQRR